LPDFSVSLLQTDAAVGRMSAGGPLLNDSGDLVGILAAVEGRDGQGSGPTLAVPVRHVRSLLDARTDDEQPVVIERPWLGIQPVERPGDGVRMARVFEDSPAAAAGFREDDVILSIADEEVFTPADVVRIVGSQMVGDEVEFTILRGEEERRLSIKLGTIPRTTAAAASPAETDWKIMVPQPGRILLYGPDGRLRALPLPPEDDPEQPLVARAIRVERSDVEKKLDELSQDVRDLKKQVEKLSHQLDRLADPPEREE
jgi:hypothetical protein